MCISTVDTYCSKFKHYRCKLPDNGRYAKTCKSQLGVKLRNSRTAFGGTESVNKQTPCFPGTFK